MHRSCAAPSAPKEVLPLLAVSLLTLVGCRAGGTTAEVRWNADPPPGHAGHAGTPNTAGPSPVATPSAARDDDPPDLLQMLGDNGTLTAAQVESLRGSSSGPDVTVGSGGLRVTSADGRSSMKVGGRVQVDGNLHSRQSGVDDTMVNDGTELRRARFELQGRLPKDLSWAAEVDFAGNNTSIKDFWVGHETSQGVLVSVGHQKQPYSLDVEMSSNDIPFVERGIDTFLVIPFVDRAIGVRAQGNTEHTFVAAGLFGQGASNGAVDDEGWGAVGRVVVAPIQEEGRVLHLGLRAAHRIPEDGTQSIRIRDETTNMSNFAIVDTGVIAGVNSVTLLGAEAALVCGPASLGGEINSMRVDRMGGNLDFSSWHAQATYTLTGESLAPSYRIGAGEFERLRADGEGCGAWELAARLAKLDVQDGAITGGEETAATLGVNWYVTRNLRCLFGWTHVLDTTGGSPTTAGAEGLSAYTFRTQFNF